MRVLVNEEPRVLIFLPSFGAAKTKMILEAERSAVSLLYKGWHRRGGSCPAGATIQEELLMEGILCFLWNLGP